MFDFAEKTENMSAIEILNYYRNLYYAEPQVTERGIVANTINDVLNLINRQKAEIERLQKEANLVSILFQDLQEQTDEAKAEAYKEFAKRLKEKKHNSAMDKRICTTEMIDNLVKEMVGEKNDL